MNGNLLRTLAVGGVMAVCLLLSPAAPGLAASQDPAVNSDWPIRLLEDLSEMQNMAEKKLIPVRPDAFGPYIERLKTVDQDNAQGNHFQAIKDMNNYMKMLEQRNNGLDAEVAEHLWLQAYRRAPEEFTLAAHDRHIGRTKELDAYRWSERQNRAAGQSF